MVMQKLINKRKEKGLSQEEVAYQMGMEQSTYSRIFGMVLYLFGDIMQIIILHFQIKVSLQITKIRRVKWYVKQSLHLIFSG